MKLIKFLQQVFFKISTFFYLWSELGFLKTLDRYLRAVLGIFFSGIRVDGRDSKLSNVIPMVTSRDLDLLLGDPSSHLFAQSKGESQGDWVWATPIFGKGSGGHHDIFMLAQAGQSNGIDQKIGLTHGDDTLDIEHFKDLMQTDYGYSNLTLDELSNLETTPNDLVIATGWQTFAPALRVPARKRAYLVQDFEPWFNPVGIQTYLAESTYKFGIPCLTAGPWLANLMSDKYGAKSDYFDLGFDPKIYNNSNNHERNAIVIYYRPGTLRRASDFALEVIRANEKQLSDFEIHFVGGRPEVLPSGNVVVHGSLNHSQLASLYQRTAVTFVLSMTNTSLVPVEALAAGSSVLTNSGPINEINLRDTRATLVDLNIGKMGEEIARLANEMNSSVALQNSDSVQGREWNIQCKKAIDFLKDLPNA
jgi:glycosyltransferase involved in cell wall biosynthesis